MLSWRITTLLLAGRNAISSSFPFVLPFNQVLPKDREAMLLAWKQSDTLKPVREARLGSISFTACTNYIVDPNRRQCIKKM